METSPVSVEQIREAAGIPEESARLHRLRTPTLHSVVNEAYNVESKQHSQIRKKACTWAAIHGVSVAASALGCWTATSSIPWRHVSLCASAPVGAALGYCLFSAFRIERRFYERERAREEWELNNYPEGEMDEMVAVYVGRGLSVAEARHFVRLLMNDNRSFVDLMMVEELGYSPQPFPSTREVFVTSCMAALSFTVCSALPLLPHNTKARWGTLLASATAISIVQAKLLLGAYADLQDMVRAMARNMGWLLVVTSTAQLTARLTQYYGMALVVP